MKTVIIGSILALMTQIAGAWEMPGNPDRFPSIGFSMGLSDRGGNYDEIDGPPDVKRYRQGRSEYEETSFELDLKLPVRPGVTVILGYESIDADLHQIRQGDAWHAVTDLDGYKLNMGFRLYLNK